MTSTPAERICAPPIPKISTSACFFNSFARRAAYISPLASPAERRICVGGIEKKKFLIAGRLRRRQSGEGSRLRRCIGDVQFLLFVLKLVETIINSPLREKLLMRALFAQLPFVEHENAVRVLNRAEPVRNHKRRAPGQQTIQGFPNQ